MHNYVWVYAAPFILCSFICHIYFVKSQYLYILFMQNMLLYISLNCRFWKQHTRASIYLKGCRVKMSQCNNVPIYNILMKKSQIILHSFQNKFSTLNHGSRKFLVWCNDRDKSFESATCISVFFQIFFIVRICNFNLPCVQVIQRP